MKLIFWFANGDNVGTLYEVEGWGKVLVFDGIIDLTQPFYFRDSHGESIKQEVDVERILKLILPTVDTIKDALE